MIQVKEFFDTYPNYSLGFMAKNEPTATDKLLKQKHNSIVMSKTHKGRYYQEYWLTDATMTSLLSCFPKEHEVLCFKANGEATFKGVRRGNSIACVCLETLERVLFAQCPFDKVEIQIA